MLILVQFLLKIVSSDPMNNMPALIQIFIFYFKYIYSVYNQSV